MINRLAEMETKAALSGQVDQQVRAELDQLGARLGTEGDVGATIEAWRDLLRTGRRITLLASIAGITSVGGLLALLTGVWDWIRSALRIN